MSIEEFNPYAETPEHKALNLLQTLVVGYDFLLHEETHEAWEQAIEDYCVPADGPRHRSFNGFKHGTLATPEDYFWLADAYWAKMAKPFIIARNHEEAVAITQTDAREERLARSRGFAYLIQHRAGL